MARSQPTKDNAEFLAWLSTARRMGRATAIRALVEDYRRFLAGDPWSQAQLDKIDMALLQLAGGTLPSAPFALEG